MYTILLLKKLCKVWRGYCLLNKQNGQYLSKIVQ